MKSMKKYGSAIVLVLFIIILLSIIGVGLLNLSYGARLNAIRIKNETVATLAAEAGYEKAVFWMTQQDNLLFKMKAIGSYTDSNSFGNSSFTTTVRFNSFIGSKPIYKITSFATVGQAQREVEVLLSQDVGGWEMGICMIPTGPTALDLLPVYFGTGEEIDMPIHINGGADKYDDKPADIYIDGSPKFLRPVSMGESRTSSEGEDKYRNFMNCFTAGIDFLQPDSQITDEAAIQDKVDKFATNTTTQFKFTPVASTSVPSSTTDPRLPAVQLEFYVVGGVGKVRITNNCTVKGFVTSNATKDWKVKPGTGGSTYEKYPIYMYHYRKTSGTAIEVGQEFNVSDTYVTQQFGSVQSSPGGQIYVNGNVVIGGNLTNHSGNQVVKGNITVVATGNIWIADSITVDGAHETSGGRVPLSSNPNAIGLLAQGVVKVIDPGRSSTWSGTSPNGQTYQPVGIGSSNTNRYLQPKVEIEAVIACGGGGWGAEYVGDRKENPNISTNKQDDLIVRGAISEVVRGVVGLLGADGFVKKYYVDERVLQGILPGDMWLKRKYIPTAAGWSDYRP